MSIRFLALIIIGTTTNAVANINTMNLKDSVTGVDSELSVELEFDTKTARDVNRSINGHSNSLTIGSSYNDYFHVNLEASYERFTGEPSRSSWEYIELGLSFANETYIGSKFVSSIFYEGVLNPIIINSESHIGSVHYMLETESSFSSVYLLETETTVRHYITNSRNSNTLRNSVNIELAPVVIMSDSFSVKIPVSFSFDSLRTSSFGGHSNTSVSPTVSFLASSGFELDMYLETTPLSDDYDKNSTYRFLEDSLFGITVIYKIL
jgi:hypothetical protein